MFWHLDKVSPVDAGEITLSPCNHLTVITQKLKTKVKLKIEKLINEINKGRFDIVLGHCQVNV